MRANVALLLLLLALAASFIAPPQAPLADAGTAAVSRTGTLGDASYRIEVPADWRGGLVVFAHGIQRGPGPGAVASPPLASHIVGAGHAWAASGYRAREYRPDLFIEDLVEIGRASCRGRVDMSGVAEAEDGIRDRNVTGVQTCALPI